MAFTFFLLLDVVRCQNEDVGVVDSLVNLIAAKTYHTCVVTRTNNLRCWGYDRATIFPTGFGKQLNIGSGNGPTIRQGNTFF